jgi:hypothetical protein
MTQKNPNPLELTLAEREKLIQTQQKAAENLDIQTLEASFALMGGYRSFLRDAWGYMDYEKLDENTIWFYHFLTTLPDYEHFATQSIPGTRAEMRLFQIIFNDEKLREKMLATPELKAIFDNGINLNVHIENIIRPEVLDSLYQRGYIRYDRHFLGALLEVDEKSQEYLKNGHQPFINAIAYLDYALDKKVDLSVITQQEWDKFYQRRMKYMSLPSLENFYAYRPEIKQKSLSDLSPNIHNDMAKMLMEKTNYLLDTHEHDVHDVVKIISHWMDEMKNHHKPRFLALVQRMQDEGEQNFRTFIHELKNYPQSPNSNQYEFRKLLDNIVLYDKLKEDLPEHEPLESSSKGFKI